MTDLINYWPTWGESGALPSNGFSYSGGDRINEKHMDGLWNTLNIFSQDVIDGITQRLSDLYDDVILDTGLVVTAGSGRVVNISGTTGAYVGGQYTDTIGGLSITLTSNGTGSTRTDTVWVDDEGQVARSTGTTNAPAGTMKLAEVDLSSTNNILAVRNEAYHHLFVAASRTAPTAFGTNYGMWYDVVEQALHIYRGGSWVGLLAADGSVPATGDLDMDGNSIDNVALEGAEVKTALWNKQEGGQIASDSFVRIGIFRVEDTETLEVSQAILTGQGFDPCPSDVDLIMVDDLGATTTILAGDGSTLYDGAELTVTYTNTSGSKRTVLIGLDNGHYGTGTGQSEAAYGGYIARKY